MENKFDKAIVDLNNDLNSLLGKYNEFILSIKPYSSILNLARFMLYTKSFNSFSSSSVLAQNGFYVDSYNSIRVGLESGWLSILFEKKNHLAHEWLTLIPHPNHLYAIKNQENQRETAAKKYRNQLGSPSWVRKQISKSDSDKKQRDDVYAALSVKSHANVSSTYFFRSDKGVTLYGPGSFDSKEHLMKILRAISFCIGFLLHDIDNISNTKLSAGWTYKEYEVINIAGIAYPDGKGGMEFIWEKTNEAYQSLLALHLSQKNLLSGSFTLATD